LSLPLCPVCGRRDTPLVDCAAVIRVAPEGSPLRYSVTRLRTYRCQCGTTYETSETVEKVNPEVMWVRKLAEDESIRPAGNSP